MPPKKQKVRRERHRCDEVEGERFHAQIDEVFQYNWWEIFCFPYILCGRLWDCCVSLCAGTNQCLVYWMMIQWVVCKITRMTTPDPIMFPYYFYMFCQVILLTTLFVLIWQWFGRSVFIPYFLAYYDALVGREVPQVRNATRLSFRRYCFRKSDIFDSSMDNDAAFLYSSHPTFVITVVTELFMYEII